MAKDSLLKKDGFRLLKKDGSDLLLKREDVADEQQSTQTLRAGFHPTGSFKV